MYNSRADVENTNRAFCWTNGFKRLTYIPIVKSYFNKLDYSITVQIERFEKEISSLKKKDLICTDAYKFSPFQVLYSANQFLVISRRYCL